MAQSTEGGDEEQASDPDDVDLHEPAPGGGVLLRAEDAPPTADPEPSEAHERGWGVLLPPEERAQPAPQPTQHIDPPSQSGPDADTEPRRGDNDVAGDAGGQAAPEPEAPSSAQGAVPSSTHGDDQTAQPAAHGGDATPPAEEPEHPYPTAGEASRTGEDGDYPMPEPEHVAAGETAPPESETQPAEEAPAEAAEGD
jgi:hypothetical protein